MTKSSGGGNHWRIQTDHIDWKLLWCSCSIAQLPIRVVPPTLHVAVRKYRATVLGAQSNGRDVSGEAQDLYWKVAGANIAELSNSVASPALHHTAGGQRTGVVASCRDGRHSTCQADNLPWERAVRDVSIAKLALSVLAPTKNCAGAGQRATVPITSHHGDHATFESNDTNGKIAGVVAPIAELP
jgi:hypothetical protein